MAGNKPVLTKMNAPKGVAKFPKLLTPDYGTAKYPEPDGRYTTRIVWDGSDPKFQAFKAKIDAIMARRIATSEAAFLELPKKLRDKLKGITINHPITEVFDDNDNPTGQWEAKFSAKAGGIVKQGERKGKPWKRTIDLYDSFGRKLNPKKCPEIWGGSTLVIAFSFDPEGYFVEGTAATGISFQLDAVQIVKLRSGGERSASDYGFQQEEGGFEYEDQPDDEEDGDGLGDDDDEEGGSGAGEPEGSSDF